MIEIFEFINKLDESGNYRLADKLDNEVRKIYAQAVYQSPATSRQSPRMQENHALNPNFAFILNQLLMKEQLKMNKKEKDTDTLSPTKKTDVTTLNKQMNNLIAQMANLQRDNKKFKANQDTLPNLEGKIGKFSELSDDFNTKITNHTNEITDITQDVQMLQDSIETPK